MKYQELSEYVSRDTHGLFEVYTVSEETSDYNDWHPNYYVHIRRLSDDETFLGHNSNMFAAAAFAIQKGKDS